MWTVAGHDRIVRDLEAAAAAGRLSHALLFVGPAGVGKTTLALELARFLNCIGDDPPCGRCVHCHQIATGSHPDVTVIEPAEGRDSIAIGQVREFRDSASLRPFQGKARIFVVAGAEALTAQAADALLKTLEEPPSYVTIVLTAPDVESLPATIVSRCRVVTLRPVPAGDIAALLEREIDGERARRIASLARGSAGWAIRALRQPKLIEQYEELLRRLVRVPDLDLAARLQLAESLAAEKKDRSQVRRPVELLLMLARDLAFIKGGLPPQTAPPDTADVLRAQAARMSLAQVDAYVRSIRVAMDRIDANVDPRLSLEALLVSAA